MHRQSRLSLRNRSWPLLALSAVLIAQPVTGTDGRPFLELGKLGWLQYQKKQMLGDVAEIIIDDGRVLQPEITVSLYQTVIAENRDEKANHRLVFPPGMDNRMEQAYSSPVIGPGERWGFEVHGMGVFPYRCSIHPEVQGVIRVSL